jgi:colanic acid/amylovoran biosynthesis protein
MRDLSLEEWVVPIADVTYERLWPMVERLRANREAYLDVLRRRLPGYIAEADRLPDLLRDAARPGFLDDRLTRAVA